MENTLDKVIGNRIKVLRTSKEMSPETIVDTLKISLSAYYRMERGETKTWASHIDQLSELFDISPEELVSSDQSHIQVNNTYENAKGGDFIVNQLLSDKVFELYDKIIADQKAVIEDLKAKLGDM